MTYGKLPIAGGKHGGYPKPEHCQTFEVIYRTETGESSWECEATSEGNAEDLFRERFGFLVSVNGIRAKPSNAVDELLSAAKAVLPAYNGYGKREFQRLKTAIERLENERGKSQSRDG